MIMNLRHGRRVINTPEWNSWRSMVSRCTQPTRPDFYRYGGKGIKVCDRWRNFSAFYADMGPRPDGMTLDRIDNNGHYEPGNCRWATAKEQSRNRKTSHRLTHNGITKTLMEWAEELGICPNTLYSRVHKGLVGDEIIFGRILYRGIDGRFYSKLRMA